jgi:hypothetical protein
MFQSLNYVSALSALVPLVASLYKYRTLNSLLKGVSLFFVFAAVVELAGDILAQQKINNLWLINIYSLIEGFIFCYVIMKWSESRSFFLTGAILFSVYFLFWWYSGFISGTIFNLNGEEKTVKAFMLLFLSGYFLIRLSTNENVIMMEDYRFWISCALMLYFSVTIIVFCTETFLVNGYNVSYYSWIIHSVTNIISNLLFAFGFIWYYRKVSFST